MSGTSTVSGQYLGCVRSDLFRRAMAPVAERRRGQLILYEHLVRCSE
jgi:hypothetical protein